MVEGRDREQLHGFIKRRVADEAEAIFTDAWPACRGVEASDTRDERVNHSDSEWVRGDLHTKGVEGLCSRLQRSLIGTFHKVTVKHLERHLDVLAWRLDNRDAPDLFRDTLARMLGHRPLRYQALTH